MAGWIVAAFIVTLVRNRLWATPNLAFFTAIADGFGSNPFPSGFDGDYLLTNVTGPGLARLVGATAPHHYIWLHLTVLFAGIATCLVGTARRWGSSVAAALSVVLAVAPVMTTSLQWLGQPDAFTLPLSLGLVVARRRTTVVALALLLGCTHAEQGIVIAVTAAVARMVVDRNVERGIGQVGRSVVSEAVWTIGGVLGGAAAVRCWLWIADIRATSSRASFLDLGPRGFWEHHRGAGVWLPIALWGLLWIPIIAIAIRRVGDDDQRWRWRWVAGAAAACILPMLVTLDETRVYGLMTAPLLVAGAVLATPTSEVVRFERLGAAICVAALIIPGFFTAGAFYTARDLPPAEFATFLRTGDHPGELTSWLLGPFAFEVPKAPR